MRLSVDIQRAFQSNDLAAIEAEVAKLPKARRQEELNTCLALAMPHGSMEMIRFLLNLGAKLEVTALDAALEREDPGLLQLLVASGWNVNSRDFECPAVQ
jgi:hypothetical protein